MSDTYIFALQIIKVLTKKVLESFINFVLETFAFVYHLTDLCDGIRCHFDWTRHWRCWCWWRWGTEQLSVQLRQLLKQNSGPWTYRIVTKSSQNCDKILIYLYIPVTEHSIYKGKDKATIEFLLRFPNQTTEMKALSIPRSHRAGTRSYSN